MNHENPPGKHILIVEDEPKLAALIADYLQVAGFATEQLDDGSKVLPRVREGAFDLMLLDIMLPGRDGLDVLKELRSFSSLPVILITARVEEIDRLLGLELGADDYVCKPFSPRELVARVKAVLRRSGGEPASAMPALTFDPLKCQALVAGERLPLTRTEYRLLERLAAHPGRIFSREQLMGLIYDDHRVVSARTVDSHIKNLRAKLDDVAPERVSIRSVYGIGYALEWG